MQDVGPQRTQRPDEVDEGPGIRAQAPGAGQVSERHVRDAQGLHLLDIRAGCADAEHLIPRLAGSRQFRRQQQRQTHVNGRQVRQPRPIGLGAGWRHTRDGRKPTVCEQLTP